MVEIGINIGIQLLKESVGWNDSFFQHQDGLYDSCQATSTLDMADVCFDGPPGEQWMLSEGTT